MSKRRKNRGLPTTLSRVDRAHSAGHGVLDHLSGITSGIPEVGLEAGIVRLVGILNSKGLATWMSCEGHSAPRCDKAWVRIQPACFKHYMRGRARKMERFLLVGEGRWHLSLEYFGRSNFRGLGAVRPRVKTLRRIITIEMHPTLYLCDRAREQNSHQKTKMMRAMERAAQKYL